MSLARWLGLRHPRTSDLRAIWLMNVMNSSINHQGDFWRSRIATACTLSPISSGERVECDDYMSIAVEFVQIRRNGQVGRPFRDRPMSALNDPNGMRLTGHYMNRSRSRPPSPWGAISGFT